MAQEIDFIDTIYDVIDYWVGKENNPLQGLSFRKIYEYTKKYGKENLLKYKDELKR